MLRAVSDRSLGLAGLVLGALALLISVNAGSWAVAAVSSLKKNSVKSAHIVDGTIQVGRHRDGRRARQRHPQRDDRPGRSVPGAGRQARERPGRRARPEPSGPWVRQDPPARGSATAG